MPATTSVVSANRFFKYIPKAGGGGGGGEEGRVTIDEDGDMCVCMVITYIKSMDQPGKVTNPARGQLTRENEYFPVRVRA